jgi:hypothetical protein
MRAEALLVGYEALLQLQLLVTVSKKRRKVKCSTGYLKPVTAMRNIRLSVMPLRFIATTHRSSQRLSQRSVPFRHLQCLIPPFTSLPAFLPFSAPAASSTR